jgi:hypothetical protein
MTMSEPLGTARRKSGADMTTARRGDGVRADINSLVSPATHRPPLSPKEPVGALPAKVGSADYKAGGKSTGGAGIASPLTELVTPARELYDSVLMPTTDGLAWMRLRSAKKIFMQDANAASVVLEFNNGLV